jgi:uncharacterized membrane protein SpoIIM required for sporulation
MIDNLDAPNAETSSGSEKVGYESNTLKSERFRERRKAEWAELEFLLKRMDSSGIKKLDKNDILRLPRLYRSALSSLSVARATSLDQNVIAYLESLCTRAYYRLYGTQMGLGKRIVTFLSYDWPQAAQKLWKDTAASALLILVSTLVGFFMVQAEPEWFYSFVDAGLAGERTPAASTESLRATIYDKPEDADGLGVFASYLFSNNSRVAIFAFALGFAFGIPTIFFMLSTGFMVGGFLGLFASRGLGMEMGGWLIIHGSTEILAIILAGGAGLHIGRAIAFPGSLSRVNSAALAGRTAGLLIAGVVIMLFFAGLLEGYARQLITSDAIRYLIGISLLLFWMIYLYMPRTHKSDIKR